MAMRIAWLKDLRLKHLEDVGGKNASLGEMIGSLAAAGIRVPGGFATTADAFREFLSAGRLRARHPQPLHKLYPKDAPAPSACRAGNPPLSLEAALPPRFARAQ